MEADALYRAAMMYYVQGEKMETIGRQLGASRSTVSRLLKTAREAGLVRISVHAPLEHATGLTAEITRSYGVRPVVVPVRDATPDSLRLTQVAKAAAQVLEEAVTTGTILGVAWGATVSEVARHIAPQPVHDVAVVQLNGAANVHSSGIAYGGDVMSAFSRAFDAATHYLSVPAFFDHETSKQMMWRESSIMEVLKLRQRASLVIFGVGALTSHQASHVYTAGYLDEEKLAELRSLRVVGDVCTNLLREDGSHHDIEINRRASGPTPDDLRQIPRRLCVSSGLHRVAALRGALRAGTITDLVIDETSARSLIG